MGLIRVDGPSRPGFSPGRMSIRESVGKKKPCRPRCSFTPESKAEIVGLRTVWVLPRTTTHPEEVPFAVHHLRQDEEDDSSALNHQPSAISHQPLATVAG